MTRQEMRTARAEMKELNRRIIGLERELDTCRDDARYDEIMSELIDLGQRFSDLEDEVITASNQREMVRGWAYRGWED
jgi:predicted nuclease with TOPRIM domain